VGLTSAELKGYQRLVPEAECLIPSRRDALKAVAEADALVGLRRAAFDAVFGPQLLKVGRRLRWVHTPGAGIEDYLIPGLAESRFTMTNGKIIQGPEVADHAFALLLALTRNLHLVLRGQGDGMTPHPQELRGKTALVIGLGGVGLVIAERADVFGMTVLGVNPKPLPLLHYLSRVVPPEQLLEVLPEADVVFVAAPLTSSPVNLINREAFAAMKPSAYLVNVGRGRLVDTPALVRALHAGRLAGAGLDVTEPEPLPEGHPLRHCANAVITPHIGGPSDQFGARNLELVRANLRRFVQGLPLLNVVNKEVGY
jgi:phosphoglycerate dehydrogenase-like enzyme